MKENILEEYRSLFWLTFLAAILYLQNSWVPGFFHDGYLYAAFGKNASELGAWLVPHLSEQTYTEFFHHTPFLFILEGAFFKVFGTSYSAARVFSSLFSLVSLFYIFNILKDKNKKWAYLACLVFILLPSLIKKTRFPSIDPPLMLTYLLSFKVYFEIYKTKNIKKWLLLGVFFGMAMLLKGPMAFFIPVIILTHMILTKELKSLLSIFPWLGLIIGFIIFSVWPLSLYAYDKLYIFEKWFNFTFVQTLLESRGVKDPFYSYFLSLLKESGPWFLLTIYGSYKYLKEKSFVSMAIVWFWVKLTLISFVGLKYSNYLVPLFPAMAIVSARVLSDVINETNFLKLNNFIKGVSILLCFLFATMPISKEIRRDKEVFQVKEILDIYNVGKINWAIVSKSYPFWNLANLNAFESHSNTFDLSEKQVKEKLASKNWLFIISNEGLSNLKTSFEQNGYYLLKNYSSKKINFVIHESHLFIRNNNK